MMTYDGGRTSHLNCMIKSASIQFVEQLDNGEGRRERGQHNLDHGQI